MQLGAQTSGVEEGDAEGFADASRERARRENTTAHCSVLVPVAYVLQGLASVVQLDAVGAPNRYLLTG